MIVAKGVRKSYGSSLVVDDVSLELPAKGITSIIGPNGAGKSTFLSMVSRLLGMDAGTVTVDGLDVSRTPNDVLARRLSILRQDNHMAARLTVADLVSFGRYPYSKGRLTVEDKHIWEHKAYVPRPALADHDGPIMKFRRWASQFYAEGVDQGDTRWEPAPPHEHQPA